MFGNYKFGHITQERIEAARKNRSGRLSFQDSADKIIKLKTTDPVTGLTVSQDMRLAVIKPTTSYMPAKDDVAIVDRCHSVSLIQSVLGQFSGLIAVDIETRGTRAHFADDMIIGIGIASDSHISYLNVHAFTRPVREYVYQWLKEYEGGMVGHNIFFDGAFLQRECGEWIGWKFDTYGMYRQLANEGYAGQRWGLKDAQVQLLNYNSKGDVDLDQWLVSNGYHSDIKKEEKAGYVHVRNFQGKGDRWIKPRKEEMWRAPAKILGYYCGVDAASTYQLLTECFLPSISGQPYEEMLLNYHDIYIDNTRLLVSQQLTGITISKPKLEKHHAKLLEGISTHTEDFLSHPEVRPHADAYNEMKIEELRQAEPTKYKKIKWPKEPKQFKKDGSISAAWENWQQKTQELEEMGPELTSHWVNWDEKMRAAKQVEHLNIKSGPQMQWLFYERLGFPIIMTTKSGQPSTGTDALPGFGEVGRLLKTQKDDVKEEGYVKACLENLVKHGASEYRLHPQFRTPGTLTCRLAGSGGVNIQQLPKSKGYLDCWRPQGGKVWIDYDFAALEQVVLAELSQDESLLSLYGPNAKPNDVYLFNAALMAKEFGVKLFQPIIDAGYDPYNPDPAIIKEVKKKHKNLRAISKVASLGKSYGMGWKKFQLNMKIQGVEMNESECRAVIDGLDKVYSGVKKYQYYLEREHKKNNGFVINGLGRPVGCARDYIKDIVNRVVQSTGHDVLMLYISICDQLFKDAGVRVDGIVWDFHDETMIECDAKDAETVCRIMEVDAARILNEELGGTIQHKLDGGVIKTFAEAKIEE